MNIPVQLVLMLVLLLLSGFFSSAETAIFSLGPLRRREMHASGGRLAKLAVGLCEQRRLVLRTILLGNLVVNVSFFSLSTTLAIALAQGRAAASGSAIAGSVGLASLVTVIIFGEIVPKMFAVNFPRKIACFAAVPVTTMHSVLGPLWLRSEALFDRLGRTFKFGSRHIQPMETDELRELVGLAKERGVMTHLEGSLMAEAVELDDLKVSEVMVPRVDVTCFDADEPVEQLRELVRRTRHSKIPVYRDSRDNILGIAHGRDVLLSEADDLEALLQPARFVPEMASVGALLAQLKTDPGHVALAVDEYGGFAGLVTLEDVVEEVVGEIGEEHEAPRPMVEQLDERRYRVAGELSLRYWGELFEVNVVVSDLDTVGGLVMLLLGRVPREGDQVEFGGLRLTVGHVYKHRVADLIVEPGDASKAAPNGENGRESQ